MQTFQQFSYQSSLDVIFVQLILVGFALLFHREFFLLVLVYITQMGTYHLGHSLSPSSLACINSTLKHRRAVLC